MIKTYFVDSFTSEPFKGNPAGVCVLDEEIGSEKMLTIANEIGFSETAFIKKINDDHLYSIRYFSPKMEIALCGDYSTDRIRPSGDPDGGRLIIFVRA